MIASALIVDYFKQALEDKCGYIWGSSGQKWTQSEQDKKVKYMEQTFGKDWKKSSDAKKSNYYNAALIGSKWIGHKVYDCSGIFYRFFLNHNIKTAHGSNSLYRDWCTTKGKLTDDLKKTILPGTAVFTGKSATDHPHIGLYVGNGKVIEAASTEAGVVTSNITAGKWTYYGLMKNIDYGLGTEQEYTPVLRKGSKGTDVKKLQQRLLELGYKLPKYGADGDFGSETESAVKQFQRDWGLTADGIVGTDTQKMLDSVPSKAKEYSVTVKGLTLSQAKALCDMYPGKSSYKEMG